MYQNRRRKAAVYVVNIFYYSSWISCGLRHWLEAQSPVRNAKRSPLTLSELKLCELKPRENGQVRLPLKPLLSKGEFMRRIICCMDVYKIQEGQAISMPTLPTSWHRSLVVYIKRAVLSMIICKQHLWIHWQRWWRCTSGIITAHISESVAFITSSWLCKKSDALWI